MFACFSWKLKSIKELSSVYIYFAFYGLFWSAFCLLISVFNFGRVHKNRSTYSDLKMFNELILVFTISEQWNSSLFDRTQLSWGPFPEIHLIKRKLMFNRKRDWFKDCAKMMRRCSTANHSQLVVAVAAATVVVADDDNDENNERFVFADQIREKTRLYEWVSECVCVRWMCNITIPPQYECYAYKMDFLQRIKHYS